MESHKGFFVAQVSQAFVQRDYKKSKFREASIIGKMVVPLGWYP